VYKSGDKLICHNGVIDISENISTFTINKIYQILFLDSIGIYIINDSGGFSMFDNINIHYYFYTEQDLRKKKLSKLKNMENGV